jgi:primosomal protein N'
MMYAYEIMVLAKGKHPETLTYFGSVAIDPFSRVIVPLRKKDARALVVTCVPLSQVKGEIKSSDFALRKIKKIVGPALFAHGYIEAIQRLAQFYAVSESSLLMQCIPVQLLEYVSDTSDELPTMRERLDTRPTSDNIVLAAPLTERIQYYKILIRQSLARKESLYICVPTVEDAEVVYSHIAPGIEKHTHLFHGKRTASQTKKELAWVINSAEPSIVVGTVPYLALPLQRLQTIVVEHETSQSYISMGGTRIDLRSVVHQLARMHGITLIISDTFPSVPTYYEKERGAFVMAAESSLRLNTAKELAIVDMKSPDEGKGVLIGNTLRDRISRVLSSDGNVFLFALKEGLGAQVVCQDCGNTVMCQKCHGVLGVRQQGADTVFLVQSLQE